MHSSQSECLFLNDWDRIVFEESTSTELEDGLPGDPRNPDTTRYHATMLTKPIQETLPTVNAPIPSHHVPPLFDHAIPHLKYLCQNPTKFSGALSFEPRAWQ